MNIALTYSSWCNVITILPIFFSSAYSPSFNPGVSIAIIGSVVFFQKHALENVIFVHGSALAEDLNTSPKSSQSTRDYIVELFPDPIPPINII